MHRRAVAAATVLACVVALSLLGAQGSASVVAPAPAPAAPRLAFTADGDQLSAKPVRRTLAHGTSSHVVGPDEIPPGLTQPDAGPVHAGEASSPSGDLTYAFISTIDDPHGEVYVVIRGAAPIRVTCNTAIESHPVLDDGAAAVAFAADAGDGFDLWVAALTIDGKPITSPCTASPVQVTNDPADDLWPAWGSRETLVFSSTRLDPLGDLFTVDISNLVGDSASPFEPEQGVLPLTDGPSADVQPTVFAGVVVFTTTRYADEGSLAVLILPATAGQTAVVAPLWPNGTSDGQSGFAPQSAEASWSPGGDEILFTSTREDPYGDLFLTPVQGVFDETGVIQGLLPRDPTPVAAVPGIAESHGTWLRAYDDEAGGPALVGYTRRATNADVADVVAADGSDRRTIAGTAGTDDAGPTYSPDGRSIAYSAELPPAEGLERPGYQLMRAAADGTGAVPLAYERDAGDIDVDPAWSPDGTRVAFVRYRPATVGFEPARIWVANLATGTSVRLSADPPEGERRADVDPTWSPDSSRLAFARQVIPALDAAVELGLPAGRIPVGGTADLTVTVSIEQGAGDVRLDLPLPAGLGLPTTLPAGCEPGFGGLVCHLAVTAATPDVLVIPVPTPAVGTFAVQASVTPQGYDPNPANNSAGATLTVEPLTDASVRFSPDHLEVFTGESVPVRAQVSVNGEASDVLLTVTIDPALGIDAGTPLPQGCHASPGGVRCALVAVGADPVTVELALLTGQRAGDFSVEASVTADGIDLVPDNSSATVAITSRPSEGDELTEGGDTTGDGAPAPDTVTPAPTPIPSVSPDSATTTTSAAVDTLVRFVPATRVMPTATPGTSGIWVMNSADGGNDLPLVGTLTCPPAQTCEPQPLPGRSPAWSPNGAEIAFEALGALYRVTLVDMGSDGPDVPERVAQGTQLTGLGGAGPTPARATLVATRDPAWSPDGQLIAVAGQPAGQPDQQGIYTLTREGAGLRPLVQGRGPETEPAFQPYANLGVTLTAAPATIPQNQSTELTVSIANLGPSRASGIVATVDLPAGLDVVSTSSGDCPVSATPVVCTVPGDLADGQTVEDKLVVRGTAPGTRQVTVTVATPTPDTVSTNNRVSVTIDVVAAATPTQTTPMTSPTPAPVQPTLRVLPAVITPGRAGLAFGENFPPGAQVTLAWSVGTTTDRRPVTVADNGTLRWPVLVVTHDQLGSRFLVATTPTGSFEPVRAPVLVVPRTAAPPLLLLGRGDLP